MTDAETDQVIKARMERGRQILDLREKYYKEYSKFLTPRQIQRVYELEKKSMKRLQKRAHISHHKKDRHSKHRRLCKEIRKIYKFHIVGKGSKNLPHLGNAGAICGIYYVYRFYYFLSMII